MPTTKTFTGEPKKSNECLNEIAFARLPLLVGGKLPVDATVTVDTLTVSEVKILDTGGVNKAVVSAAGNVAAEVKISALPSGAATAAKQPALGTAGTPSADVITVQGKALMTALLVDGSAVTQPVSAASLPLPTGATTATLQGALTETAPATDTASSGLNGRLQRIAQRITSLIALLPSSLGIKTSAASLSVAPSSDGVFPVTGTFWQATQPVSGTVTVTYPTTSRTLGGAAAVTGDGTVTSGKYAVTFLFSSDFSGTIAGTSYVGANDRAYETPPLPAGNTYGAISYTVAAGSMRIIPVT